MLTVLRRSQHVLRSRALSRASSLWLRSFPKVDVNNFSNTSLKWSLDTQTVSQDAPNSTISSPNTSRNIPLTCPGCGAPSQTVDPSSAGFYGKKSKREKDSRRKHEDAVFNEALARGAIREAAPVLEEPPQQTPICDRCHNLMYQSSGKSIIHPSTQSIREIIEESPHRQNHIYHVLDAADFPMSLIPNLTSALHLPRLRTQNRRSKSVRYIRDRVADISFIITRSDLLAPKKEQVDKLLPYIRDVLRDALGRSGRNVRLGNIRLVSSKRGWWTKDVKEEIYERGGAGWMVGKVNVGKSALVEVVYPKGRTSDTNVAKLRAAHEMAERDTTNTQGHVTWSPASPASPASPFESTVKEEDENVDHIFDESNTSLLPPAQVEVAYPVMPIVSALPGTTASPIRLPFGNGKGELVDLPGIERSALDTYIKEEHRKHTIMTHRIVPEQYVVKPGQSLLLGGLIRITPKSDDLVFLMYAFLPEALHPHITSTEKAIAVQTGVFLETGELYAGNVKCNATDDARRAIKSAGSYRLRWDVTKQRAGPVTSKVAGKQQPHTLPYMVYALDLLIEGVGWVEIVAQVRRKAVMEASYDQSFTSVQEDAFARHEAHLPEIEVFSPLGQFVGVRRPMNGWVLGGPKQTPVHKRRPRPRQSMSYQRRVAGGRLGSKAMAADT